MNRADQASEPSMEEILASIRLIISDDARKGPSEWEEAHSRAPAAPRHDAAASLSALPEEDVLDLTDALVFPEEQSSPAAAYGMIKNHAQQPAGASEEPPAKEAPVEESLAEEEQPKAQPEAAAANPEPVQAPNTPFAAMPQPETRVEIPAEPRHDLPQRPAVPAGSRTVWSRRELPGSPAGSPKFSHEPVPVRHPHKNRAEDIQMPIPDRGPISLISAGEMQARVHEPPAQEKQAEEEAEADHAAPSPGGLADNEEAAVAAVAESLARAAAEAMDANELATAADVDFARLDEDRKAEVTETFANAIQRESAPRDKSPLPTLLDEVLRQDFMREPAPFSEPVEEAPNFEAPAEVSAPENYDAQEEQRPAPEWAVPEDDAPREFEPINLPPEHRAPAPRAPETSAPEAPLAQAQFVGASQPPLPVAQSRTLEDAVRDMLRPLLMQWLNDNMPRILESAIRDEIATRGLLPKADE